jgi:hypothetical protein
MIVCGYFLVIANFKLTIRTFILLTFFLYRLANVKGQSNAKSFGQLKVNISKKCIKYWDRIIIQNKDTTIFHWTSQYNRTTKIDSIPVGQYTVTINSIFNDNVEKVIAIKTKTSIRFDVKYFYHYYRDTISLLERMTIKDNIRIN